MAHMMVTLTCPRCGQEFTKETSRYTGKRADNWVEWMESQNGTMLCDDCEKEVAAEKARAKAEERGWAQLEGSEKQIAWASRIREEFLDFYEEKEEKKKERYKAGKDEVLKYYIERKLKHTDSYSEATEKAVEQMHKDEEDFEFIDTVRQVTSAKWWIETKGFNRDDMLASLKAEQKEAEEVKELEEKAKTIEVLTPEDQTTSVEVIVTVEDGLVSMKSDYDRNIVDVMHKLSAKWNKPYWTIKITNFNGTAEDRAAEAIHELLEAGIPVKVENEEVKEKALTGTYAPEQKLWIKRHGNDEDYVYVDWGSKTDYYDKWSQEARKLPGAKWDKPCVKVPVSAYREILDFAELNGFEFSDGALDNIWAYKASQVMVTVADAQKPEQKTMEEKLKEKLEQPVEPIEDLLDD